MSKCDICKLKGSVKVCGVGPENPDIVIVGEAPGETEVKLNQPFVGASGRLLDKVLQKVGLKREEIYITNAVLCHPEHNRTPGVEEVFCCRERLIRTILKLNPKLVVVLGGVAASSILNQKRLSILSKRGFLFNSKELGCRVLVTLHPAAVLRDFSLYSLFFEDFYKASNFVKNGVLVIEKKYNLLKTKEEILHLFKVIQQVGEVAFDIETTGLNPWCDEVLSFAFCFKEREAYCFFTPFHTSWSKEDWVVIEEGLCDLLSKVRLVIQNALYESTFLKVKYGWNINCYFDTMLAHHILDENLKGQHGLKRMATRYLDLIDYANEIDVTGLKDLDDDRFVKYTCSDVDATWRLYKEFYIKLKEENLEQLFFNITMPLVSVIRDMQVEGIGVDIPFLQELESIYSSKVKSLVEELKQMSGIENPSSSLQLSNYLYKTLRLPVLRKTVSGKPSTDDKTLKDLLKAPIDLNAKKFLEKVLLFRKVFKLYRTYIVGIGVRINPVTSRLHAEFLIHGTRTGRLSSVNPNLQNIAGEKDIKNLFLARPGCKFIEADYKQLEFRVFMNYIGDQKAFEDLKAGFDIHKVVASRVLNKPVETITEEERTLAKGVVFGLMYGMATETLAKTYGLSLKDAEEFVSNFWKMYSKAKDWVEGVKEFLKKNGYVVNLFGRRRRLPSVFNNTNLVEVSSALRQGVNAPIQGGAADITNYALIQIHKHLLENNFKTKILIQVHDSILLEAPEEEVDLVLDVVKKLMLNVPGVNVPLDVDIKVVKRWGEVLDE